MGSYANYRDYTYDNLSQLTKSVERFSDGTITTTYAYDKYGNITSKSVTKDGATTTYAYTYGTDSDAGWSKLLKSYNGHTIDYDAIGNPISYMGATMEWSNGRQLTKYTKDGSTTRYTYDADGLRATKTVDGVKHTYLYVGGQLMYEKWSDKELYFWYDGNGHLMALRYYYNDDGDYSTLYAMTNAMGDVLGLYSVAGNPVVTNKYDVLLL